MAKLEILTVSLGCGKCKKAMEIINKAAKKYGKNLNVKVIDIIKSPEKLIEYNILITPSIILDGKLIFEGVPNVKELDFKIRSAVDGTL